MKAPIPNTPEIRCRGCNKLLARGAIEAGDIELHCPRCKTRPHLRATRRMTASTETFMNANHLPSQSLSSRLFVTGLAAFCLLALPDIAAASGGITEFSSPLEKVVNTITGPAGKWISIVAMALCGVIFIMNKDDISGSFKLLLSVVFGISFIAFAASIVNSVFSFSGAVI